MKGDDDVFHWGCCGPIAHLVSTHTEGLEIVFYMIISDLEGLRSVLTRVVVGTALTGPEVHTTSLLQVPDVHQAYAVGAKTLEANLRSSVISSDVFATSCLRELS